MTQKKTDSHDPYSALRIKDFRFHILSRLFLTIGVQMQAVIVGWQIYEITKDVLSLGLIGLAEAVPAISIAFFAGQLIDRKDRRSIILYFHLLLILASVLLVYLAYDPDLLRSVGASPLYISIFITGVARGFLGPAISAFMPQLVPRNIYANSSTWNSTVWQTGAVAGPAAGGLIYATSGYTVTYVIAALCILISFLAVLQISPKPYPKSAIIEPLKERLTSGIKFVFANKIMLSALSLDLFAVLFGGAVALLPVFAEDILKVGPEGLGMLRAAPAAGAILMAIILAFKPPTLHAGRNLLIAVAAYGLCMIFFALSTSFYLSLFILALSGMFDNVSVVIRSTIMQLLTPDHMRGRVSAVNTIFIGSSNEIGAVESGVAAKFLGLITSVVVGGIITLTVVGITATKAPSLRRLSLNDVK